MLRTYSTNRGDFKPGVETFWRSSRWCVRRAGAIGGWGGNARPRPMPKHALFAAFDTPPSNPPALTHAADTLLVALRERASHARLLQGSSSGVCIAIRHNNSPDSSGLRLRIAPNGTRTISYMMLDAFCRRRGDLDVVANTAFAQIWAVCSARRPTGTRRILIARYAHAHPHICKYELWVAAPAYLL